MTPQEPKKSSALDAYYRDWERKVKSMREETSKIDWSGVDWSKLDPKDVGVMVGPPMTEEQFAEYRKRRNVTVLRAPSK